jgi:hypothetical protein
MMWVRPICEGDPKTSNIARSMPRRVFVLPPSLLSPTGRMVQPI